MEEFPFIEDLAKKGKGKNAKERLEESLRKVRVVAQGESLIDCNEIYAWAQRGAETYTAAAEVKIRVNDNVRTIKFIAKAILYLGDIEGRVNDLLERRRTLESSGVHVPQLYSAGSGTTYEQYIDSETKDVLLKARGKKRDMLIRELCHIAAVLDKKFPMHRDILRDTRSDGQHVYWTDFLEDLGGASESTTTHTGRDELLSLFKRKEDKEKVERNYKEEYSKIQ